MEAYAGNARRAMAARGSLFEVEDFLHDGETLAGLEAGNGFEEARHFVLPLKVDGIAIEGTPGRFEILDVHEEEKILIAAKDGIVRDADFLELRKERGPDVLMGMIVFGFLASFDAQTKSGARHVHLLGVNGAKLTARGGC